MKKINYIESYLCFFTFGFLIGISKEEFNIISLFFSIIFSLIFAFLFIKLMSASKILYSPNRSNISVGGADRALSPSRAKIS